MIRYFTIFALLLVAGCQYNPFAHRFLTKEPTSEEVIGEYQLKEVYVDMVDPNLGDRIRAAKPTPTITLHRDGNATLVNFPFFEELDRTFDYNFKGLENLDARCEISMVGSVSSGGNHSKKVYGILLTLTDGRSLFDSPSLTGKNSVDGMIFTLYDGDQGQILGYTKTKAEQGGAANPAKPDG